MSGYPNGADNADGATVVYLSGKVLTVERDVARFEAARREDREAILTAIGNLKETIGEQSRILGAVAERLAKQLPPMGTELPPQSKQKTKPRPKRRKRR
jgi:hypothetical protein